MRDAWRLAVGTFTALPTRRPGRVDARALGGAMLLAPLTALPAAAVWVALGLAAAGGWVPSAVAAVLAVVATALLSRALHLDGLADLADGLTSGHDRERSLTVMRRGDTGPAGVAAVVLVLLLDAACLADLFTDGWGVALAATSLVSSRLAAATCARHGIPPARPEGLGRAVAGTVGRPALVGLGLGLACLAAGAGLVVAGGDGFRALAGGALVLVAAAAALAVRRRAVTRLGGVTGDVIGAAIEISVAASLVAASVLHLAL